MLAKKLRYCRWLVSCVRVCGDDRKIMLTSVLHSSMKTKFMCVYMGSCLCRREERRGGLGTCELVKGMWGLKTGYGEWWIAREIIIIIFNITITQSSTQLQETLCFPCICTLSVQLLSQSIFIKWGKEIPRCFPWLPPVLTSSWVYLFYFSQRQRYACEKNFKASKILFSLKHK